MTDPVKYVVAREHTGDDLVTGDDGAVSLVAKHFVKGDTRTADPTQVKHLVDLGVLSDPAAKAEEPVANKADTVHANKAKAAQRSPRPRGAKS